MFLKRLFTTLIWFSVIYLVITYKIVFALCFLWLAVGGLYEFFTLIEKKGIRIYKYFGIAIGTIIPLSILLRFELTKSWELSLIVLALVTLFILQFRCRDNSQAVISISTTLFGILYVSWFFSFLIKIRDMPNGQGYLLAILLITKSCDIGAYLVGSIFGKHALIPRISPKKSVEGSLGGLLFSGLIAVACKPLLGFSYGYLVVMGVGLGFLAQLGDLSESLVKRDCQVKDSGQLFPGMGGFLDLIDSLLFTAPVFYFYLSAVLK